MHLRNEADKIGSNIEDYLENLDSVLARKANSIVHLQRKIAEIRGHL